MSDSLSLFSLGWDAEYQQRFDAVQASEHSDGSEPATELQPARVTRVDRGWWTVSIGAVDFAAELRGRLHKDLRADDRPVVGDWVAIEPPDSKGRTRLAHVLPRRSVLRRKAAGATSVEQVVAANVDLVGIVVPADAPPNPHRLERQLAVVWESGAQPLVIVTKIDLLENPYDSGDLAWLGPVTVGTEVVHSSVVVDGGVSAIEPFLTPGRTVVLLGPSGAGKSALTNRLIGFDAMAVGAVGEDRRGRHTTTHRELHVLPSGACLIDTPGIREVGLVAGAALEETFADVAAIAEECRFSDCGHATEPGCAVRAALANGDLTPERVASWEHLQREARHQARRVDRRLAAEDARIWAQRAKDARERTRR